jgi:cytoskeletal protein RodZ
MRNKLAITVLMIGMTGAASAQSGQQYYQAGGSDTPLKTDAQSNDDSNNNSTSKKQKKELRKKSDPMPETPSGSAPNRSSTDHNNCGQSQSPDPGPQNTNEYGG